MSSLPRVSVVIATYNYGRFLSEAVASVRAQTYPSVELLVVDDGSTDDTAEVARGLGVAYVRQPNGGVCRARNHGAMLTGGELLMFLDADDVLRPDYIARCQQALASAPPAVAYAYTQMEYFGLEQGVFASAPFSRRRVLDGGIIHASALMKREAFAQTGGYSLRWVRGHEDMELWVRLFSLGHEGVLVPAPLLRYRRHGPSRNRLSQAEIDQLDLDLWRAYPRFYWRRLLRHRLGLSR